MKTSGKDMDTKPPQVFRPRSQSSAKDKQPPRASLIRRQSASVGEASTLPRKLKADRELQQQQRQGNADGQTTWVVAATTTVTTRTHNTALSQKIVFNNNRKIVPLRLCLSIVVNLSSFFVDLYDDA